MGHGHAGRADNGGGARSALPQQNCPERGDRQPLARSAPHEVPDEPELQCARKTASRLVKAGPNELPEKIERLIDDTKKLEKELAETKRKLAFGGGGGAAAGGSAGGGVDDLAAKARQLPFGKVLAAKVDVPDGAMLRELAEKVRDKLGDAVVLLGSISGPKAQLVCTVSKSLTGKLKAGDLIRPIAQMLGGSGGGRPDMAQAGGTDVARIDEALEHLYTLVG